MRTLIFLLLIPSLIQAKSPRTAESARPKPNVVVILVDDMGWQDTGFAGSPYIETPELDRYASSGTIFTQAYASAPNCAPTRACLMSGQ